MWACAVPQSRSAATVRACAGGARTAHTQRPACGTRRAAITRVGVPRGGRRALAVHAVVAVMAWRGGPHAIAHTPQGVSTLAHYNHQHRARHTVHAHIVAKLGVAHHTHREQPPHARGVCGCGGKAAGCGVCRSQVCCDVAVIVCVGCSMGGCAHGTARTHNGARPGTGVWCARPFTPAHRTTTPAHTPITAPQPPRARPSEACQEFGVRCASY